MKRVVIDGVSCTLDNNGKYHSFNDEPAKIYPNGDKVWWEHGLIHRENGPAVILKDLKDDSNFFTSLLHGKEQYWLKGRRLSYEEFRKTFIGNF